MIKEGESARILVSHFGQLEIDVQTQRHGNSAIKVFEDSHISVYHGPLHARVTLKDCNVDVTMNPDEDGNWKDPDWATARAWDCVREHLTQTSLATLCAMARQMGRQEGAKIARQEMRAALGIPI